MQRNHYPHTGKSGGHNKKKHAMPEKIRRADKFQAFRENPAAGPPDHVLQNPERANRRAIDPSHQQGEKKPQKNHGNPGAGKPAEHRGNELDFGKDRSPSLGDDAAEIQKCHEHPAEGHAGESETEPAESGIFLANERK